MNQQTGRIDDVSRLREPQGLRRSLLIIPSLIRMSPLTPRREPASEMRASRISTYPG